MSAPPLALPALHASHGGCWLRDVHGADEVFVTGTFGGLTPVRAVDDHQMPAGTPGPVTQRLRELYDALKDEQALYAQMRGTP